MKSIKMPASVFFCLFFIVILFQNCGESFRAIHTGFSSGSGPGDEVANADPNGKEPAEERIPVESKPSANGCSSGDFYDADQSAYSVRDTPRGKFVYYRESPVIGANPNEFVTLNSSFGRDSQRLYFGRSPVMKLQAGDQFAFRADYPGYAFVTNRKLVVSSRGVLNVDYDTFEIISYGYYRDQYHLYGNYELALPNRGSTILGKSYLRDGDKIYYHDKEMDGANASQFQVLQNSTYDMARDGRNIYYYGQAVTADNGGQITLRKTKTSGEYWIYQGKIYSGINELGPENQFTDLQGGWLRMGDQILHQWGNLENEFELDPNTFQVINAVWAKDSSKLIRYGYQQVKIPDGNGQWLDELPGFSIDFISGSFAVINGYPYLNSLGPLQEAQVSSPNDITCLGNYYRINGRMYDHEYVDQTQTLTDKGLDVVNAKSYIYSSSVLYDGNGLLNRAEHYLPFSGTFTPVNSNYYHDGSFFRSIQFDPEDTDSLTDQLALLNKPLSELLRVEDAAIVLDGVFSSYSEFSTAAVDTNYIRQIYNGSSNYFVFADGFHQGYSKMDIPDINTFDLIFSTIFRDNQNVFYSSEIIDGLDPNTPGIAPYGLTGYWFANQRVFYGNEEVPGLTKNQANFLSLNEDFRRSGNTILFREDSISEDGANFQFVAPGNERTWKDSNQIGYRNLVLTGLDPNNVQVLGLDDNNRPLILKGSTQAYVDSIDVTADVDLAGNWSVYQYSPDNPKNSRYWTDGSRVFYRYPSTPLPGANPATFKVNDDNKYRGKDGNVCYAGAEVVDCD